MHLSLTLKDNIQADQEKNWKSANRNDSQKGTSWAYDLGSEQQLCPIVVEDLGCPGTMLIEVCHVFFTIWTFDYLL